MDESAGLQGCQVSGQIGIFHFVLFAINQRTSLLTLSKSVTWCRAYSSYIPEQDEHARDSLF